MPRRGPGRGVGRGPAGRQVGRAVQRQQRQHRRRRRRRVLAGGAIVVGGGALAYKLTKGQAKQIEEHTGVPVEELSDEEIQGAMNELSMKGEPLTAQEEAEAASQPPEDEVNAEDAAPAAGDEPAYMAELKQLAALHQQGILSDEEFEAKKKQILGL
jgi:hypothetical protein